MRNLVLLMTGALLGGLSTFGLLRFVQVEHAGPRPVSADTASPFKVTDRSNEDTVGYDNLAQRQETVFVAEPQPA
jgi:hypothetical protein